MNTDTNKINEAIELLAGCFLSEREIASKINKIRAKLVEDLKKEEEIHFWTKEEYEKVKEQESADDADEAFGMRGGAALKGINPFDGGVCISGIVKAASRRKKETGDDRWKRLMNKPIEGLAHKIT